VRTPEGGAPEPHAPEGVEFSELMCPWRPDPEA
jgi:hypothetical protein